jgi:hypothetical protein
MNNSANTENHREQSAEGGDWEMDVSDSDAGALPPGPSPGDTTFANDPLSQQQQNKSRETRNRSPTPPRALFRSTTGKGVAFTNQDRDFLIRFMDYRK